ncbi:hypothetical protein N0V90_012674 [Kalmusia sp. IMI 367209]|nr:hypothetical protein N0V90_012674 [Kalmusia sp. IMI 367209]
MPLLSRQTRPLLRSVKGKRHANAEDHVEDARARQSSARKDMTEEEICAEPMSSSDEAKVEATPQTMSQSASTSTSTREKPRQANKAMNGTSIKSRKTKKLRVPQRGAFERGKAHEEDRSLKEEKENWGQNPSNSVEKRVAEDSWGFGMEYEQARKRQRTMRSATSKNVHAAPNTFGKKGYGRAAAKSNDSCRVPKEEDLDHIEFLDAALNGKKNRSAQDMISDDLHPASSPAKPARQSLLERLGYAIPSSDPTNIDHQASGASTPLSSVPEIFENPSEPEQEPESPPCQDEDAVCALCQEIVDVEEQEDFWRTHHSRTVRNQMLFCKEHKRRKAQSDYHNQGFPEIDWAELPYRIRKFEPDLIKLLKNENEEESEYRKKHAEKLLSGKAAALPSRRRNKKEELEQDILETFDAASSSTGYYGPRGRRIMMEVITTDHSDLIREIAAKDPVVGRSGFAVFLQAVLVPELTTLLVMEDKQVGKCMAYEIVKESAELGTLLHEEVDDEIEVGSDLEREEEEG